MFLNASQAQQYSLLKVWPSLYQFLISQFHIKVCIGVIYRQIGHTQPCVYAINDCQENQLKFREKSLKSEISCKQYLINPVWILMLPDHQSSTWRHSKRKKVYFGCEPQGFLIGMGLIASQQAEKFFQVVSQMRGALLYELEIKTEAGMSGILLPASFTKGRDRTVNIFKIFCFCQFRWPYSTTAPPTQLSGLYPFHSKRWADFCPLADIFRNFLETYPSSFHTQHYPHRNAKGIHTCNNSK